MIFLGTPLIKINKIIVNERKTKSMCFGTDENLNVFFNEKPIEQLIQYKYLGVIVWSVNKVGQDMYSNNYRFISDKCRRVVFSIKWKLKFIQSLPLNMLLDIFDTLIRPIFTYGSDVWGLGKTGIDVVDEIFLNFVCCILSVKATTCNVIFYGECGRYPFRVFCHINVLLYLHRLWTMPVNCQIGISKSNALHGQGFSTFFRHH